MSPGERKARIGQLLTKYPEPWVIEKEPHDYNDGTSHFTHVRYYAKRDWSKGETMCIEIGSHVTPDLAELLVLLREEAMEPTRTCATCGAVLDGGPQPTATYEKSE